jgi:hypothetical protein
VEAAHARRRSDQSWYKRGRRRSRGGSSSSSSGGGSGGGSYVVAPWWPGQCIDCSTVGSKADPTNTFCSKCAGTWAGDGLVKQQGLMLKPLTHGLMQQHSQQKLQVTCDIDGRQLLL